MWKPFSMALGVASHGPLTLAACATQVPGLGASASRAGTFDVVPPG
ncbi:MAG: hypothetical protein LBJ08_07150 [Bifidobacteriaceae bacterium]|nr:hypothetical protein [Bifidobacteriaceae bacterium]